MRSMPITAFLPAFIALFGMDEAMKVGFLFFGMFFYLLAVVVEEVEQRGPRAAGDGLHAGRESRITSCG